MDKFISCDGTAIAYDQVGSGSPIILVGGAFSYRAFPKTVELAERLADRFTVINYDRRGRGDSGDAAEYAVEREIEDIAALIDAVGGSASLWGWSSGAVLALRAAAAGVGADGLAVYEPPAIVGTHPPRPADFLERLERHLAVDDRSAAVQHYMTQGMGVPAAIVAFMRMLPVWRRLKDVAHTLPYDWTVLGDLMSGKPLDPGEWAGVTSRAQIMAGGKSPALLRDAAAAIAGVLPRGELRVLEGQSHNPSMKVQAAAVSDFLAGRLDEAPASARLAPAAG